MIDMTSTSPYCSCSKEYEGVNCETGRNYFYGISLFLNVIADIWWAFLHLDKCSTGGRYLCNNGGVCKILDQNITTCDCPKQFYGDTCDIGSYLHNVNMSKIQFAWLHYKYWKI